MKRISILLLLMALFIGTKAQTTQWNSGVTWVPSFRTNNGATEMRFALGGIKPFYMLSDSLYKAQMAPRLLFNSLTGITRSANIVSIDTTKLATRNFVLAQGGSYILASPPSTQSAGINISGNVDANALGVQTGTVAGNFSIYGTLFPAVYNLYNANAIAPLELQPIEGNNFRILGLNNTNSFSYKNLADFALVSPSGSYIQASPSTPQVAGINLDGDIIANSIESRLLLKTVSGDYGTYIKPADIGFGGGNGKFLNLTAQHPSAPNSLTSQQFQPKSGIIALLDDIEGKYIQASPSVSQNANISILGTILANDEIRANNSNILTYKVSTGQVVSLNQDALFFKQDLNNINYGTWLHAPVHTDNRHINLPDKSGTVALLSDITGGGGSSTFANNGLNKVADTIKLGGDYDGTILIGNLGAKPTILLDGDPNSATGTGVIQGTNYQNNVNGRSYTVGGSYLDIYGNLTGNAQAYLSVYDQNLLKENRFLVSTERPAYYLDSLFKKGIDYKGINFANFTDSTLVPKKYVVDLLAGYTPSSQVQNSLTPASTIKAPSVDAVVTALATKANTNGTNATGTWPISITGSSASDATKVDKTTTVNGQPLSSNVSLTKSDVGLSNVDNTSDANKPVSTAQSSAIALKENTANKQNSLTVDGSGVKFPTVDAVNSGLSTKQNVINLTTTGSSGAASLIGNTLNIPNYASGGGSGTVTAVTVTTANGVSASVANQGTTPALTFTLGAITPTTINGTGLSGTGSIVRAGNHALTFTTSAASNATVPAGSGTLVYLAGTNTWPNAQTMSSKLTVNNQTDLAGARTQIGFVGNAGSIAGQSGNQFPLVFPASLYIASANAFRYSGIMTAASTSVAGSYQTNLYVNSTADNNNTGGTIAMTAAQDGKVEFPVAPTTSNGVVRLQDLQALAVTPVSVAGTSQTMSANTLYVPTSASLTTFTLPATATFGQRFQVVGDGTGGWRISQNSGQQIVGVNVATTSGTTGYIQSTNADNTLTLIAISSTRFKITSSQGTLTIN